MSNLSEEEYKKIRRRVRKRFEQRTELATHLVAYLFVNIAFHAVLGFNFPMLALILSAAWGMGLAIHATQVIFETGIWVHLQERAVQREIEMELYHKEGRVPSFAKKRKNEDSFSHLRIGYDGELVSVDESEKFAQEVDYQD